MDLQNGFTLLLTNCQVSGVLPVEIIPNYTFRRPTALELTAIRHRLAEIVLRFPQLPNPFEHRVVEEPFPGGGKTHGFEPLPEHHWRYYGIGFTGSNREIYPLQFAATLLHPDLDFGFTIFSSNEQLMGIGGAPMYALEKLLKGDRLPTEQPLSLSIEEIAKLGPLHSKIESLPESAKFVRNALDSFFDLRSLPRRSALVTVGLFAIIENLVTHKPRGIETLDSINHQLTNKLALLEKRLPAIDRQPFNLPSLPPRKFWARLYSLRSAIAHGETPNFTADFKDLKSSENVSQYLRAIVKELLIYALDNHDFLADLKEC